MVKSSTFMSSSSPSPSQTLHSPPITIVLTVILLIFFLLGFFSIYFCRCIVEAVFHTWHFRRAPSAHLPGGAASGVNPARNGLDRALIKSLPTFLYSTVKDVRKDKYALECAICLLEFTDDSFLRLLTLCYHVFHQECIDLWLESHKTCPVCRRNLDSPHLFPDKSPLNHSPAPAPAPASVRIEIDKNEDEERLEAARAQRRPRSWRAPSTDGMWRDAERFSRSHSTGHSIVRAGKEEEEEHEEEDRYTLKLPEHVRQRILRARHWTASCEAYKWEHHLERLRYYASSAYDTPLDDNNNNTNGVPVSADQASHDRTTV